MLVGGEVVVQDGLEVIDHQGRRLLHARLAEIDAQPNDRPDLREERDAITRYLGGATGLAGRDRTTGSHSERARVAVRKAIIAALARIAEADPWLGRHLRDHIVPASNAAMSTNPTSRSTGCCGPPGQEMMSQDAQVRIGDGELDAPRRSTASPRASVVLPRLRPAGRR